MKLLAFFLGYSSARSYLCATLVENREECQAMCDLSSHCGVWTLDKQKKRCLYKKREGWSVKHDSRFESGFKNQGPWFEPDTDFNEGDYDCS